MRSINIVILRGSVGKDPEVKSFANGGKVANFSVATSERWKDKNSGEWKSITEWHYVVINSPNLIDRVIPEIRKGCEVLITGMKRTRKWTDSKGLEKYNVEISVGSPEHDCRILAEPRANGRRQDTPKEEPTTNDDWGIDDEIPF